MSYIYWISDTEYYKTDYIDSLEDMTITENMEISTDRFGPEARYIVTERKPYIKPGIVAEQSNLGSAR
jgi:hypothetical protein